MTSSKKIIRRQQDKERTQKRQNEIKKKLAEQFSQAVPYETDDAFLKCSCQYNDQYCDSRCQATVEITV